MAQEQPTFERLRFPISQTPLLLCYSGEAFLGSLRAGLGAASSTGVCSDRAGRPLAPSPIL
jgi:hypothetical protein